MKVGSGRGGRSPPAAGPTAPTPGSARVASGPAGRRLGVDRGAALGVNRRVAGQAAPVDQGAARGRARPRSARARRVGGAGRGAAPAAGAEHGLAQHRGGGGGHRRRGRRGLALFASVGGRQALVRQAALHVEAHARGDEPGPCGAGRPPRRRAAPPRRRGRPPPGRGRWRPSASSRSRRAWALVQVAAGENLDDGRGLGGDVDAAQAALEAAPGRAGSARGRWSSRARPAGERRLAVGGEASASAASRSASAVALGAQRRRPSGRRAAGPGARQGGGSAVASEPAGAGRGGRGDITHCYRSRRLRVWTAGRGGRRLSPV